MGLQKHVLFFSKNLTIYLLRVAGNDPKVEVRNFEKSIEFEMKKYVSPLVQKLSTPLKKVGVLISGSGTNLQALIDATHDPTQQIGAEIVLVISNKPGVEGLKRAERAGISTKVRFLIIRCKIVQLKEPI